MDHAGRRPWIVAVILAGGLYFVVGIVSIRLAGAVVSNEMRSFWRLSAFVVSGVVFAAHLAYEHFRLRHTARSTAWHASLAAALGGFALALMANIHDLGSATGYRRRMLVALVVWPLLTGVPAFLLAFAVAAALGVKRRHERNYG